jgi:hypothetical protein
MKTIEEAAKEYAEIKDKANAEFVMEDFIEGVKFAQRWISVDEELPEIKKETYKILVKSNNVEVNFFWVIGDVCCDNKRNIDFFKIHNITHWRLIELK